VVTTLAQSACGQIATTAPTVPSGAEPEAVSNLPPRIDPCSLLTTGDAEKLFGSTSTVGIDNVTTGHAELLYIARCKYASSDGARDLRIEIMVWTTVDDAARQFASARKQIEKQVSRTHRSIPDVGDESILSSSPGSAGISFRYGPIMIGIGLTRTDGRSPPISEAKVIEAASNVFGRLRALNASTGFPST
jgi:hypothetical protein